MRTSAVYAWGMLGFHPDGLMMSWCLSRAINTRDSTDTVTDTHCMNGTRRHSSDPNTQWSINVYMTVKGRQKTHTRMSENDRLQMKIPVTLTFSLRRAMMQMRPMFPSSPSTMVRVYHTTTHPVRIGDIGHWSYCLRTARSERSWVLLSSHSCTDSWLVLSSSHGEERAEVELLRGRAVADGEDLLTLPFKDISPGLQCRQPPGSNCPSLALWKQRGRQKCLDLQNVFVNVCMRHFVYIPTSFSMCFISPVQALQTDSISWLNLEHLFRKFKL